MTLNGTCYIYFADPLTRAAQTVTVTEGVHADFDRDGKLIGIEVIEASKIMGEKRKLNSNCPNSLQHSLIFPLHQVRMGGEGKALGLPFNKEVKI